MAEPASGKGQDQVLVTMAGKSGDVFYRAPANLDGEGIRANLGAVGTIDLTWRPSGRVGMARFKCRGYRANLYLAEGFYGGSVHIAGEHDFTEAALTRVKGRTGWYRYTDCGGTTSEGFPGPGVLLEAFTSRSRQRPNAYRYFSVVQNRPGGRVSYMAELGERRGRLSISRLAFALGRARTLSFDRDLDTATVDPPSPFAGSGMFERVIRGRPGRWLGDLVVDFPGRPAVAIAGDGFEATFEHGFRESHSVS
ncbi:MAG TPA: hypothetical protein VFI09_01975 [Solirubrobacterales bacterium]|nr:hypothetical protein [Solirubrobacterales bacterium]